MSTTYDTLNNVLVRLFHDIMTLEEKAIRTGEFSEISNNDMHIIEAIGIDEPRNMSFVAKKLSVTVGTLTIAVNNLVKKEYDNTNPIKVFEDVYNVILDRKKNPKEGSYTNYLFDKGIDKILKKVGEEATEIVIAAKNPDPQEVKYEISDFLYHVMVLMAEKGVTWKEITKELSRR